MSIVGTSPWPGAGVRTGMPMEKPARGHRRGSVVVSGKPPTMSFREGFGIVGLVVGSLFLTHGLSRLAHSDGGRTVVVFAATPTADT